MLGCEVMTQFRSYSIHFWHHHMLGCKYWHFNSILAVHNFFFQIQGSLYPFFSNSGVSYEQILALQKNVQCNMIQAFGSNRVIIMFLALIVAGLNNGVFGRVSNSGIHLHSLLLWGFQSGHRLQKTCGDTIIFYLFVGLNMENSGLIFLSFC